MPYTIKKLENSQVELTIAVPKEDYKKHFENAAKKISERLNIKGFRKGKVPYEMVKKEVGEMNILQEALEIIIQESFFKTITEEKLETVGRPEIKVEKVAPDNDVIYKAIVAILPKVTLPDLTKIKVKKEIKETTEEQIKETIDSLRGMRAKEIIKNEKATKDDKLVIDMDMKIDNVSVEGGLAKDYQVYLSEKHYIPGFNEEILKAGAEKNKEIKFDLDFPKDHYQKMLAGKKVTFEIKVKDVFERQLPEFNDEFAKTMGQKSADEVKKLIKSNLEHEAIHKADQKAEIEILEQLTEKAKFEDIPEILIDSERKKMFHELTADLEKNGISIEQYLGDIKKTEKELFEDFKTQAEKRAKASLISRQIALENKETNVSDEELEKEIEMMKEMYKANPEYLENLKRADVKSTIATSIQNRKVMKWLFEKITGEEKHEHNH